MARLTGFVCRSPRKLHPRAFLLSCMALAFQQSASLRNQAILAGIATARTLSKQALHKRLGSNGVIPFLQNSLAAAIASSLAKAPLASRPASFARILVQDSTCLSLSSRLAQRFPGPSNQHLAKQACLRIQCLYDLLSERFVSFSLCPFTRNDQASACDLLPLLKASDMVLRDLGYFTITSLKAIALKKAFFLTRWRYGAALFDPENSLPIPLARMLRKGQSLDIHVLLGHKEKFPVRLIALPLPENLANQRRRKARANRDKRLCHSAHYMHLLGWNIFLTNACSEQLPLAAAATLYRLRWRVEILFKSWKSHFALTHVNKLGSRQVEVMVYGLLLFAVLFHHHSALPTPACARAHPPRTPLSLLRVAQLASSWLLALLFAHLPHASLRQRIIAQLHAHCRYDSRLRSNYPLLRSSLLS